MKTQYGIHPERVEEIANSVDSKFIGQSVATDNLTTKLIAELVAGELSETYSPLLNQLKEGLTESNLAFAFLRNSAGLDAYRRADIQNQIDRNNAALSELTKYEKLNK